MSGDQKGEETLAKHAGRVLLDVGNSLGRAWRGAGRGWGALVRQIPGLEGVTMNKAVERLELSSITVVTVRRPRSDLSEQLVI